MFEVGGGGEHSKGGEEGEVGMERDLLDCMQSVMALREAIDEDGSGGSTAIRQPSLTAQTPIQAKHRVCTGGLWLLWCLESTEQEIPCHHCPYFPLYYDYHMIVNF